jgi:hypothetical protein
MVRVTSDETGKKALELYKSTMDSKIESNGRCLEDSLLKSCHSESKSDAIEAYNKENPYAINNASFGTADKVRKVLEKVSQSQRKCNHALIISLTEHSEYLGCAYPRPDCGQL